MDFGGGGALNHHPLLFCKSVYNDYGNLRCLLSEKATFQTILGQNGDNATGKKPETRINVDFLFERAIILPRKPARKIGSKLRKSQLFETNLDPN